MANYDNIRNVVTSTIYSNSDGSITGDVLQSVLLQIIDALGAEIDKKVTAESGKGLSTNDFTTALKNKLNGIAAGATANVGTVTGIIYQGQQRMPEREGIVNLDQ